MYRLFFRDILKAALLFDIAQMVTRLQERRVIAPAHQVFETADYHRAFTLTEDLDTAGITAALKDGLLRVEIPKFPRVPPHI